MKYGSDVRISRVLTDFLLVADLSDGDLGQGQVGEEASVGNKLGGSGQDDTVTIVVITVQRSARQCSTVQHSAAQCSTVQYNAVQCSTMQYNTVQSSLTW